MIENGKRVKFNFTLKTDGEMIESTKEKPFEYVHGEDNLLPALKEQLEGMTENEEKKIVLEPQDAYGEIKKEAFQELPRDYLSEDIQPQIGMTLQLQTSEGEKKLATIAGIRDDSLVLNFNHPLAGKTLTFEVKVLEISPV